MLFAIPLCFFLLIPSFLFAAPAAIAPERDVIRSDSSKEPEWKSLWDIARKLTRQEKYPEAAQAYARLLALKRNIEEASWEYSLVLIAMSDWNHAAVVLEDLLERDPRRTEYLLSAGLVALKKKEYARAATYYDLVYQKKAVLDKAQAKDGQVSRAPGMAQERPQAKDGPVSQTPGMAQERPQAKDGQVSRAPGMAQERPQAKDGPVSQTPGMAQERPQAMEALTGLVAALQGQGKDETAYPLMEELFQHRAEDSLLLKQLAAHAAKSGRGEKALLYYEKLVSGDKVEDRILLDAAVVFERFAQAAPVLRDASVGARVGGTGPAKRGSTEILNLAYLCWEKYLRRHPDYLPFQEKMANYLLAKKMQEAALPHLLILLAHGDHGDKRHDALLQQIGAIYLHDLGRPEKALVYYEEYSHRHPENQTIAREISRIQSALAHDLVSRVGSDGATSLWNELAPITPNRLAIYSSMAQLLEKQGNSKELREAFTIIHQHDPKNQEVILRLAELALEQQDMGQADHFLGLLLPEAFQESGQGTRYLLASARLAEQRGLLEQALAWYLRYLEAVPGEKIIRLRCMELLARLGLISQYEEHYQMARRSASSDMERMTRDLQYARVLLTNGLPTRAKVICQRLIVESQGDDSFLAENRLLLADSVYREGNTFEAEQILRKMLVDGVAIDAVLRKLVDFALESQEPDLAWSWGMLLSGQPGYSSDLATCGNDGKDLTLLRARALVAAGEISKGIGTVGEYQAYLARHCPAENPMKYQAGLMLAHLYLQDGQYDKSRLLIAKIIKEHPLDLEPLILGQQLDIAGESGQKWDDRINNIIGNKNGNKFLKLMQAAQFERKYGKSEAATDAALEYVSMALRELPESVMARVAQSDLLREKGNLEAASTSLLNLAADYPKETSFERQLLEVEFKQGLFKQIITKLAPVRLEGLAKTLMAFPDTSHLEVWQRLILARSLWADMQWVASVAVYDTLLQPSVDMRFTEKIAERKIQIVLPPPQKSFWNVITLTHPAEPDRLAAVMEPVFLMKGRDQSGGTTGADIGADLYADYRWQQLVSQELSAKRSLAKGNYYQAMKEYQDVVAKNPSPESLFDLAGIYSRLGLLGKEALLYEEMGRDNPDYPDLAEAIRRNGLKREPRVRGGAGYSSLSGRDGYQDIQQVRGGAGLWMLPTLRQEMDVSWSAMHAIGKETEQALWRNRLLAAYSFFPHSHVDFITKIGVDKAGKSSSDDEVYQSSSDVTPLYHLEMRGRIGDELHGFARLQQDVVEDTVQALAQGISKRELEGGITLDILPRLFCGGEYLFREYSDANHQNRYHVWVSYVLHSEPTLLQVTYGQELLHNSDANMGRDFSFVNGFAPGDHPYWSPREYWQNKIAVHFEHQLGDDVLGRGVPSYYTLDYSFGYEEGGYDNHTFRGDIFLEMSRHFLLSGNIDMIQGGQVIRKDIGLSLIYRW